jgi:integrase
LARTPLSALKHNQIEAALCSLLRAPAKRRAHISVTTLRHIAGFLNVALNKAFKLDLIPVNPMLRVELPSAQKPDARALTHQEFCALRDVCRGDWTFSLVELALAIGARRGELLAATWKDVDWTAPALTISKSLEQTASGVRVKAPKTGKARVCLLPQTARVALQFQREQQVEHKRKYRAPNAQGRHRPRLPA